MPKIDVVSAAGKKVGTRDLSADVFEARVSIPLMHQVVVAGLASVRRGTHSTKTRGEVWAAVASHGARRAPGEPARGRTGRRNGRVVASCTARSRAITTCGSTRR